MSIIFLNSFYGQSVKLLLLLSSLSFINNYQLYSQVDTTRQQEENKSKIIFKDQSLPDTTLGESQQLDSTKPKIIFKEKGISQKGRIEMISSEEFTVDGETFSIGEDGINLKRAMSQNPKAVEMVESAYGKKSTGTLLMITGGAIAIAGYILPQTWVKLNEEKNETYVQTWYWFPGVTVGLVVGGIGYVQYSSVTSRLHDAIDYYNQNLKKSESAQ